MISTAGHVYYLYNNWFFELIETWYRSHLLLAHIVEQCYMYICTCTCFITPFNNVSARHPKSNIVSSRTGSSIYQNGGGAPSHSWPYIFFSPLLFSSDLSSNEWRNLRHHWIHYIRALTHVGVISWGLISDEMVIWKKCYIVLVYDNTILSRIIYCINIWRYNIE